ncbi:ABC transporter permease [Paenibacillus sp. J22TS3]|uniref:ABC transporter permease n=1 Tax=Paenibacillus sp. J22TS3 TaxID=2807192 RepID=UPI001B128211|nr:ABC transporter permease [Paenibacillus sp. J22TS3]GIP23447.1 hypothetical protein J22TS3_37220 [Paenibacillus sp. J22TS3]
MGNLIRAELYKLKSSKILYIMVILLTLLSLAISYWFRTYSGQRMMLLVFEIQLMFPLIIVIGLLGASFISGEYKSGGFKKYIYFGHNRGRILLSKSIVYLLVILLLSVIMPLLTTLINSGLNGFGGTAQASAGVMVFRTFALSLLVYVGVGAVAFLISMLFKNSLATIGVFFGLYNLYVILQAVAMKSEFFRIIYEKTILGQIAVASSPNITAYQIWQLIVVALLTIALSLLLSVYWFRRTEIK